MSAFWIRQVDDDEPKEANPPSHHLKIYRAIRTRVELTLRTNDPISPV